MRAPLLAVVAVVLLASVAEARHALRLFPLVEAFDPAAVGAEPCGAPAPPRTAVHKFAASQVVVTGKVTSIEKEVVEAAAPYVGAKEKEKYRVAVVKIDTALSGADKLKEIRVGFLVPPKVDPKNPPRRPVLPPPALKEGQEMLLFLSKHPSADFYVMPWLHPPVDLKDEGGKKELEVMKRFAAALADPMKGLKSDKPEVRAETAAFLIIKYRAYPELATGTEEVRIPADEGRLILAALAGGDWNVNGVRGGWIGFDYYSPPLTAFQYLNLTEKDGWIAPVIVAVPGQPAPDYGAVQKDAFTKWLAGPGKDYRIKKIVPKKK
jgi:hypothetical protein